MRDYRKPQKLDLSGWQSAGRMEFEIVKLMNPHLEERAKAMAEQIPSPQPAQATHTPGPWSFYDDSNDGKTNRIEIVAIGKTVARIYHSVPDEDLPNARLIAAAPELLGACLKFMDGISILNDGPDDSDVAHAQRLLVESFTQARAAIAKATGVQA